ncbi:hypothetical protein KCP78_14675 [Salmonella enterica subsp. enterica]|nr:hypothetical protein KCP78_14675 [Salmonella enterica subsp. enterica]
MRGASSRKTLCDSAEADDFYKRCWLNGWRADTKRPAPVKRYATLLASICTVKVS